MQTWETPTYKEASLLVVSSIANLRLQQPPTFAGAVASSQTSFPVAILLGSASAFGGNAAIYAWDATSVAADNNSTVIVPTGAQVGGNPGRWRMLGGTL